MTEPPTTPSAGRRVRLWSVTAAALAGAALAAALGTWQLDRAAQKQALRQAYDERADAPPLAAGELARDAAAATRQHQRRVRLSGRWMHAQTVYLDNRPWQGRAGFIVATPLVLDDGRAVLVQRGWMPRDLHDRTRLAPLPTPGGAVLVEGRIAPPPARLYEFDAGASGAIRQNLDIDAFGRETGLALAPLSVQQLGEASDGLRRDWPPPGGDDRHRGYAFQWFALGVLITVLYVWFQLVPRRRR